MGYFEVVKELIKGGVDLNLKEGYLMLLIMVCCEGYLKVVELLI